MKALHFDGQKMTFLTDYDPPKPGETLVKINLAGICGTDIEILSGYMSYQGIPGHEFVGVIKESQDSHLIGKRVVGEINVGCGICELCNKGLERHCPHRTVLGILRRDGAFAQYLSLPEKNLHVIPDQIRDEQAVFVEPLAAAFEIKEQISLKQESNIALVGDGRLAQLVALVLNLSCQNITCFGRHKNKLE
jgi:threonine dehydrogenase-like Zn-dependent dehydrogenase